MNFFSFLFLWFACACRVSLCFQFHATIKKHTQEYTKIPFTDGLMVNSIFILSFIYERKNENQNQMSSCLIRCNHDNYSKWDQFDALKFFVPDLRAKIYNTVDLLLLLFAHSWINKKCKFCSYETILFFNFFHNSDFTNLLWFLS